MDDAERELTLRWIRTWAQAGPELEAIRRRELEAMTDADVRSHIRALFTGGPFSDAAPARESGLVEQQRWFAKAHPKP